MNQDNTTQPEEGKNLPQQLVQLTPKVWYLPQHTETDRPLLGYIHGDSQSLLVDAGMGPNHIHDLYQTITRNGLRNPNSVVISHWHWDHILGLAGAIKPRGDELWP